MTKTKGRFDVKKILPILLFGFMLIDGYAQEPSLREALKKGGRNIAVTLPEYPQNLLAQGIVGRVLFEFGLDAKGSPKAIEIIESEPAGVFDSAVINALGSWRYLPNMDNPCSINDARAQQQLWFEIKDGLPLISMSKVLDLPTIKPVLGSDAVDRTKAVIVAGGVDDDRYVLVKNSEIRYKQDSVVHPKYPPEARAKGHQGLVVAHFIALPSGKIGDVSIAYSLPSGIFDREVKRVLKEQEVETTEGKLPPRKIKICQEYTFLLK